MKFQEEFNQFRYNLYTELGGFQFEKYSDIYKLDSLIKPVEDKIIAFLENHQADIEDYQTDILRFYSHSSINLALFKKDTSFVMDTNELDNIPKWALKFNQVEPIGMMFTYWQMIISRLYTTTEMVSRIYKEMIAKPLIFTQEIKPNVWYMYYDHYDLLMRLEYHIKT